MKSFKGTAMKFKYALLLVAFSLGTHQESQANCRSKLKKVVIGTLGTLGLGAGYAAAENFQTEPNSLKIFPKAKTVDRNKMETILVTFIGDSLFTSFELASPIFNLWDLRTKQFNSPILDNSDSPDSVQSFSELMQTWSEEIGTSKAIELVNLSRGGAHVLPVKSFFRQKVIKSYNFDQQVDSILEMKTKPNLVGVWIGHNDTDWLENSNSVFPLTKELLSQREFLFGKEFENQLSRLSKSLSPGAEIVVFKLLDFRKNFKARATAEQIYFGKDRNSSSYPYLEECYSLCKGYFPEVREGLAQSVDRFNLQIDKAALKVQLESPKIKVTVSENIYIEMDYALEDISNLDAWHFSVKGRSKLAKIVFDALVPKVQKLL